MTSKKPKDKIKNKTNDYQEKPVCSDGSGLKVVTKQTGMLTENNPFFRQKIASFGQNFSVPKKRCTPSNSLLPVGGSHENTLALSALVKKL